MKTMKIIVMSIGILFLGSSCATMANFDSMEAAASPAWQSVEPTPEVISETVECNAEEGAEITSMKHNRDIIFTADVYLLVDTITSTLNRIASKTDEFQGYMQSMDSKSIIVRIPADRFKQFLADLGKMGKILKKNIKGQDVTEKMLDLNVRLDNAENMRKSYIKLLEKGGKMEDLLKVEKALGEVTEEIERMKGKLRHMKNQVAFSTFKIYLNSPLPQKDIKTEIPISWVKQIGSSIGNTNKFYYSEYYQKKVVDFELPRSFMMLAGRSDSTTGMSPEGTYFTVWEENNSKGGDIDFWTKLITNSLEKRNSVLIKSTKNMKLGTDWPFALITGEKRIRNKKYSYLLALTVFDDSVYLYEIWGNEEQVKKEKQNLIKSIRSMEVGTFWDILFTPSVWFEDSKVSGK